MLVLALPAKSFQLYFNFIQSATSPFFLPALSRIFVQMAADGRKKEHTSLLSIIRVELRDDEGERERERSRATFNFSTTTAIVPFRAESRQIYDVSLYTAGKPELSHGD